ncbi:NADH dehydrogenase I, G subunit [Burkholderia pseudomallei Pakistan 9]|nr:NADH dehydrogenase I, G subunit [Burkholderia pseudomallei Pakistan 9]
MVELEIDGKKVEVPEGSMVIQAAHKADTYIPHFCYHKKLSVAANCRMCLVEVEKMPKAVPACATPVSAGMIVHTNSEKAVKAQQSVMEFLLINHPLDCPICDQGGECQLQDLAVGYGKSTSRYAEEKRVVFHKEVGPLISMEEMSRCIHCTRCVRFGQEIAGVMEFGMLGRGEHSEITTFVGKTVDSELSGNMIDLCPVGALTSKPFRYSARTWELSRRKSVSPHDSVGANLVVQVKNNRVMRVLPFENEAVNECWISDKDRFSYEGLNSEERLTKPMIKQGGEWREVDWQTALEYVARGLKGIGDEHGPAAIAALGSAHSTVEELFLLKQLAHELKTPNVDFRLRQTDFSAAAQGAPWLGMPIADLSAVDAAFVVGSFLRRDHPLFAARLRQAAKNGAKLHFLHATGDDALIPTAQRIVAAPSAWLDTLAGVAAAVAQARGVALPEALAGVEASDAARSVAQSLANGERRAVLLGNSVVRASAIRADPRDRAVDRREHGGDARLPDGSGEHGRRAPRRRAAGRERPERARCVRAAAQGLRAPERRAGIRHRRSRAGARRAEAGGDGRRAVAVQVRPRLRGRAAADLAVHRDGRHVRERGRPRAVVQRRRASARRHAARMEGVARARQPARPAELRVRDVGRSAARRARRRRDHVAPVEQDGGGARARGREGRERRARAPRRRADLSRGRAVAPRGRAASDSRIEGGAPGGPARRAVRQARSEERRRGARAPGRSHGATAGRARREPCGSRRPRVGGHACRRSARQPVR